jgi:hypothetical protein
MRERLIRALPYGYLDAPESLALIDMIARAN